jgi:hypothetical protein
MVDQTTAQAKYQSQSIKYRMVVTQLQALTATIPSEADLAAVDKSFDKLEPPAAPAAEPAPAKPGPAAAPAAKDAPRGEPAKAGGARADGASETRATIAALRLATRQIAHLIAPAKEGVIKTAQLVHKYRLERDAASAWIEAFDPAVHGHTEAAEHYE